MKLLRSSAFILIFQFLSSPMNAQETIITGTLPADFMGQDWALLWQKNEKEYGAEYWDKFQDGVDAAEDFIVFWEKPKQHNEDKL